MADTEQTTLTWTLGVDVGEHSVGLAAVEYPSDGECSNILAAISYIHDGGADPDGQVNESRKARAGVARRTRRLRKRRGARLLELENELRGFHCMAPDPKDTELHAAWKARGLLVASRIDDAAQRRQLLALAIMHMGHYRGWRNPWTKLNQLKALAENGPSDNFIRIRTVAVERFGPDVENARTLGELASRLLESNPDLWLRPRPTPSRYKQQKDNPGRPQTDKLLFEQIRQEDIYRELMLITEVQGLEDKFFNHISEVLFKQEAPSVPLDRVARDDLDPESPRAPIASLPFQEFRIRDTAGNLRLADNKAPLPPKTHEAIVQYLLKWRQDSAPYWQDVEAEFDIRLSKTSGSRAPVDTTSITIEHSGNKGLREWWNSADPDRRAALVLALSDSTGYADSTVLDNLRAELPEKDMTRLDNLQLPPGRASYGLETLRRLNDHMREHCCDLYTAREQVFGVNRYWQPAKESFAVPTGQPTVDRNLAIVDQFLRATTRKWGPPSKVVVELAREGTLGDVKLNELQAEQRHRAAFNNRIRKSLEEQGIPNPSSRDVRKYTLIERQGSQCLYCGAAIGWDNTELDHIVPRASGGSSRVSNLAAVCRLCNHEKGKQPFGAWAKTSSRAEVGLDAAIKRVYSWTRQPGPLDKGKKIETINKEFEHYKTAVVARLKRVSEDEPLDERSLASTSYAAVAVRERIEEFLERQPNFDHDDHCQRVQVYSGGTTSLARRHGEFSRRVMLRGEPNKTRLDRRHHALDAIVLTSIRPSVARVLAERDDLARDSRLCSCDPAESANYFDSRYADQELFRRWLGTIESLADSTKALVAQDQIPVIYPLRLRPQIGRMHNDTGYSLIQKRLRDAFSAKDIQRITDRRVYEALLAELAGGKGLPDDPNRHVIDEHGTPICGADFITLFPHGGGMVKVGTSGFDLGTIHHARLYAWRKKGQLTFGMIRVYGGEFGRIGFRKPHVDLLRAELPTWSESWRLADHRVLEAIASGEARYIGWLVDSDELDFGPITSMPGGASHSFFDYYPETRWRVAGFPMEAKIRLRPLNLAAEGLSDDAAPIVETVVKDVGWLPVINDVCSVSTLRVIRRTALGRPRWTPSTLPISWSPYEEATRLLNDEKNAHDLVST